jgi:hypothetical protein
MLPSYKWRYVMTSGLCLKDLLSLPRHASILPWSELISLDRVTAFCDRRWGGLAVCTSLVQGNGKRNISERDLGGSTEQYFDGVENLWGAFGGSIGRTQPQHNCNSAGITPPHASVPSLGHGVFFSLGPGALYFFFEFIVVN